MSICLINGEFKEDQAVKGIDKQRERRGRLKFCVPLVVIKKSLA